MTKHIEPAKPASDRPVLEIEVTQEMVEAGVEALCEMRYGSSPENIVGRIWLAMASEVLCVA